ncbi:MAG: hypothetical protein KA821_02255 [Chitinophagaceae bacterium]|nr:hypothetical protein [Chitinophagaceae bacterium]
MEKIQTWRRLNGERIAGTIEDELIGRLEQECNDGHLLKACIGTDSQVKGRTIHFATVIVLIRKGKGGFMYVLHDTTRQKMTVKERMLFEVAKSIEVAYRVCNIFSRFSVDMEVHADINTNPAFKSNEALREAMGYIRGMGFSFRAKPYAFASSACANKMVQ